MDDGIDLNEDAETFQRQALEIVEPGDDFDPNSKPKDGVEFLTHMLYERRQQPVVMVHPMKSPELPVSSNVLPDDAVFKLLTEEGELIVKYKQTKEWKKKIVTEFLKVREHFEIARKINEQKAIKNDEEIKVPQSNHPKQWIAFCRKTNPLVDIIVDWSQKRMETLLVIFCDYLRKQYETFDAPDVAESEEETPCEPNGNVENANVISNEGDVEKGAQDETKAEKAKDAKSDEPLIDEDEAGACGGAPAPAAAGVRVEDMFEDDNCEGAVGLPPSNEHYLDLQNVDVWYGLWIYALLIGIDMRLSPDMQSTIRHIARLLILFRHRIPPEEVDEQQPYNMIITLIAKVFGQLDFDAFV